MNCLHCHAFTTQADQLCCSGCRFLYNGGWSTAPAMIAPSPYDQEEVRQTYNLSVTPGQFTYRFSVEGLQCSSCVHVLEDLPLFLDQVKSARVHFARSELYLETTVDHSLGVILQFLKDMGYPSRPLRPDENRSSENMMEDRALLTRVAVAGACAGNIMLFAVAIYGGLIGSTAFIFNGVSLLLFLPIIFYCATPFHKSAWNAIRLGYLTVDIPLVIALWAGFLASIYNWWRGSGHVYFDSTAGFFFFILLSRWFLRVSQRRWSAQPLSIEKIFDGFYTLIREGETKSLPAQNIKGGDVVHLRRGERLPADGILQSPSAVFDTSWITGEPVPRTLQKDMPVSAGFQLLSDEAQLFVSTTPLESVLSQSLRRIESTALSQSRRASVFDKTAQWLLLSVFSIALGLMIFGPLLFHLSLNDAFERALGLLVVACPCALAFGGPMAYAMGLRRAAQQGILLKSADVLDCLSECKNLAFDKTGTLTLGQLRLVRQTPTHIPEWMKAVILDLEKASHHPVAYSFREIWNERPITSAGVKDVIEVSGKKYFGIYNGRVYAISSGSKPSAAITVDFTQDEKLLAGFEFEDELREESPSLLKKLSRAYTLNILSGDTQERVNRTAQQLQVPFESALGNCSAESKAEWIKKHPNTLMLGDGLNDAEALCAAHVGVVVQGPLLQGLRYGSVYFMRPGLRPLEELFEISRKTQRLVRRNLSFALFYNITAGAAAIFGFIDPLVAAVLMPLSSLIIIAMSWRSGL